MPCRAIERNRAVPGIDFYLAFPDEGRLPLLHIFKTYIWEALQIVWKAIREGNVKRVRYENFSPSHQE